LFVSHLDLLNDAAEEFGPLAFTQHFPQRSAEMATSSTVEYTDPDAMGMWCIGTPTAGETENPPVGAPNRNLHV